MKIKANLALSDSGFVFDPATGDSFSLNPQASEIIRLIREGKSSAEIQTHFLERYETDAATIEKDLYDFLNMLKRFNLLERDEKA